VLSQFIVSHGVPSGELTKYESAISISRFMTKVNKYFDIKPKKYHSLTSGVLL